MALHPHNPKQKKKIRKARSAAQNRAIKASEARKRKR